MYGHSCCFSGHSKQTALAGVRVSSLSGSFFSLDLLGTVCCVWMQISKSVTDKASGSADRNAAYVRILLLALGHFRALSMALSY